MQPRINTSQIQFLLSSKVKIEIFDIKKSYPEGVLVQKDNSVYLSLEPISPSEFDSDKWLKLGDASDIQKLQDEIDKKVENVNGFGNVLVERTDNNVTVKLTTYIHEQGIASDSWKIEHNLDKYPSITVVDSTGTVVNCEVTYIDKNNCILTMNAPFKGKAYLN